MQVGTWDNWDDTHVYDFWLSGGPVPAVLIPDTQRRCDAALAEMEPFPLAVDGTPLSDLLGPV